MIPLNKDYKIIETSTSTIIQEGNKRDMLKIVKRTNAVLPKSVFLGYGYGKHVGEQF